MSGKPNKAGVDKALYQSPKEKCQPTCKGPTANSTYCGVCFGDDQNKAAPKKGSSAIKPWLEKAAQKQHQRRLSADLKAKKPEVPLKPDRPQSAITKADVTLPLPVQAAFAKAACTNPSCRKKLSDGKISCTQPEECKKALKEKNEKSPGKGKKKCPKKEPIKKKKGKGKKDSLSDIQPPCDLACKAECQQEPEPPKPSLEPKPNMTPPAALGLNKKAADTVPEDKECFLGIDVGTGSVRAALISKCGNVRRVEIQNIKTWNIKPNYYEQSSDDIWNAVCICVKKVKKGYLPEDIKGISFDATSSLVCLDTNASPLSVSPSGKNEQNIILWLDHRAILEAEEINSRPHAVLKTVGGRISPEMQIPKLLWIKKNLKEECWDKVGYFFDLPDFLTWRATDSDSRSICSLVCKWNYQMETQGKKAKGTNGWDKSFFTANDLLDLSDNDWKKIGSKILVPGCPVEGGLSGRASKELGLKPGTPVATSIIDAQAGGLGLIGCRATGDDPNFDTRLCLICGTSTSHLAVSEEPIYVNGIWGPYLHAMVPGMSLNEGGQAVTGKLLDYLIDIHPAAPAIKKKIGNMDIQAHLNGILRAMQLKYKLADIAYLTRDIHVWPDFHGNISPIADPTVKGMLCGLTLDSDEENLAIVYLATIQALCYGTRFIIEKLRQAGYQNLKSLLVCGNLIQNPVFTQTQADTCGMHVIIPNEFETVFVGNAILAARASGLFPDTKTAIQKMTGLGEMLEPDPEVMDYHNNKYRVFIKMFEHQKLYKKIMECKCQMDPKKLIDICSGWEPEPEPEKPRPKLVYCTP